MSPKWSTERYDDPSEEVKADAARLVAGLLDDDRLADPEWTDRQGWRYALPDSSIDRDAVRIAEDTGLYVAGDWVAGEGRVHRAVETGLDVAERITANRP
jgi:predicted NAD/FAD-dependent oxidoreductase